MSFFDGKQAFSVLVIDDSTAIRETTADILASVGYEVVQASGGIAGLAVYETQFFDLVILDVNMPEMDGVETYRELMLLDPEANVIVYSTESKTAVSKRFAPLAIPYFLPKPVDISILFNTVRLAISGTELFAYANVGQNEPVLQASF